MSSKEFYRVHREYDWYRHVYLFREIRDVVCHNRSVLWMRLGHGAKGDYEKYMPPLDQAFPEKVHLLDVKVDDKSRDIIIDSIDHSRIPPSVDAIVLQDDWAQSGISLAIPFATVIKSSGEFNLAPGSGRIYCAVTNDLVGMANFALRRDHGEYLGPDGFIQKNLPELHKEISGCERYKNLDRYVPKYLRPLSRIPKELMSDELRRFVQSCHPMFDALAYEADYKTIELFVADKRAEKFAKGFAAVLSECKNPVRFISKPEDAQDFAAVIDFAMNNDYYDSLQDMVFRVRWAYIALHTSPFDPTPILLPIGWYMP